MCDDVVASFGRGASFGPKILAMALLFGWHMPANVAGSKRKVFPTLCSLLQAKANAPPPQQAKTGLTGGPGPVEMTVPGKSGQVQQMQKQVSRLRRIARRRAIPLRSK